jgi:hypothetical protein
MNEEDKMKLTTVGHNEDGSIFLEYAGAVALRGSGKTNMCREAAGLPSARERTEMSDRSHKHCITPDVIDSIMAAIRGGDQAAIEAALKPHAFLDMLCQMGITRGMKVMK